MGSSILLASPSIINIYQADVLNAKDALEDINEENDDDIFDNPEYIDTLEGRLSLAEAARMIAKDSSQHNRLFDKSHATRTLRDCYKRLFTIGAAFLCIFSSYYSLRNQQSSMGSNRQLNLLTYGFCYLLLWFGGICASPIIHRIRPKYAMVMASLMFFPYSIANFLPQYYTLLPAALCAGCGFGLLFAAEGVYLMNTASTYALVSGKNLVEVIGNFNAVIFSFFMGSSVLGNLLSSLILGNLFDRHILLPSVNVTEYSNTTNVTEETMTVSHCGLDFYSYPVTSEAAVIPTKKKHIFFGVCLTLSAIGSLILIIFLKKLKVRQLLCGVSIYYLGYLALWAGEEVGEQSILLILSPTTTSPSLRAR